ncbi:NAD(P)/FAD-dependent oxidoreductase [Streptomyces rhizosphaerihabitans]|uniref:NAD(P)/FAD-dependent oxidoreductase n=1 Tax=Streptomyces rhizosphaerihabitans TaxID=1266770 RepID=UPI0021C2527F|nr:FAD-dependent oxidoreductase [Streptomyces rhizosphaerihabitans]MCT9010353.1 FAD-binding oxidoreductase [Streptomyces rhizosphaerihabitans]
MTAGQADTPPSGADAVVVGAGVIGAAVALELARTDRRVVVVDKSGGVGHGSTSASSAIIRFNYSTWDGVATAWESRHCWARWAEHLGTVRGPGLAAFRRTGAVLLDAPGSGTSEVVALFERAGVPYERWDAATLRSRIPGIDAGRYGPPRSLLDDAFFSGPEGELGALFTPDAGFVDDPQLAAQNLADAAARIGVRFLFRRAVVGVLRGEDRVAGVRLADGTAITAPVVVNAAGPWSGGFNRTAGVGAEFTVGVRPLRQEVHQVAAPVRQGDGTISGPGGTGTTSGPIVADVDLGTYLRPSGGHLLIGSTLPDCDPREWLDDPDECNPHPTPARFETQVTRAARRFPLLGVPNRPTGIAGVYDAADDWSPIYDRTDLAGFYVAMGTSGNQFKNAPLAGRFLATLVDRVEAGHDHDHDPLRYTGEHTGVVVDLGAFSRRRPLAEGAASRTVMG